MIQSHPSLPHTPSPGFSLHAHLLDPPDTSVIMDVEKKTLPFTQHEETFHTEDVAHLTNQEDHEISKWQAIRHHPWSFGWCLFAVWVTLLVSYENQASGTVLGIPQFRKDFGSYYQGDYVIPAGWQAAFGGGAVATTAVGALCAGLIADAIGRKYTLMAMLALSYVSITLEFVATTNAVFFGGKVVNGLVVGVLAAVGTTYVGEISPLALRGLLTCLLALAYTVGPLVCSLILNSTGTTTTRWAYRAIFCSQYGFLGVATIFVPFMPESPWWLLSRGKQDKALRSLKKLGYNKEGEAEKRLAVIQVTLEEVRRETEGVTYLECFRKSNLRRTIICIAPLTIQAIGGVIFIAGYSTYYQQLAGYSTAESFKLFIALQIVSMVGNICSWDLVDRLGRRTLTLWGSGILTVLLLVVGGLAAAGTTSSIKGAIALMIVYGFLYNITIGSTAYNLLAEVATSRLRVKTISIGICSQSLWYTMWSFVLPYLFNPDHANLGAKVHSVSYHLCTKYELTVPPDRIHLRWPLRSLHYLSVLLSGRNCRALIRRA
jgi:MFS transporter, SP family, general alpha glucoside:H+ symporter